MRIQLEILYFEDGCRHRTILAHKNIKDSEAMPQHPTIVLVSGKGVISKSYDKDKTIIQRVTGNDSLYHSFDNEHQEIAFVRKEQVDGEIEQFSKIIYLKICNQVDDLVINETIAEFYKKTFTIHNLFKYQGDSKLILAHLIKKIEIPLLISVFVILLLNFFVNTHFSELNNSQQMELMNNKKNSSKVDSQLKDIQKLKAENMPVRSMDASILIDLLATQIPNGITVSHFAVDPLRRKVETQKTLNIEKNTIILKGETLSANEITILTNNIANLDFTKNVRIRNIAQKQDEAILEFEIEITY